MAQHEPQPEEAATRPAAAVAQFAGSYTQTSMYGRALAGRGQPGAPTDPTSGPDAGKRDRPGGNTPPGKGEPVEGEPNIASTLTLTDDPALRRMIGRFDPTEAARLQAEEALRVAREPAGQPWGPEPPPEVIEPGQWTFAAPAASDTEPAPAAGGGVDEDPPAGLVEELDPVAAAAELDSAAAQLRLQIGQVEPPPITLPGPSIGLGPV